MGEGMSLPWYKRVQNRVYGAVAIYGALMSGALAFIMHGHQGPGHVFCLIGALVCSIGGVIALNVMGRTPGKKKGES